MATPRSQKGPAAQGEGLNILFENDSANVLSYLENCCGLEIKEISGGAWAFSLVPQIMKTKGLGILRN